MFNTGPIQIFTKQLQFLSPSGSFSLEILSPTNNMSLRPPLLTPMVEEEVPPVAVLASPSVPFAIAIVSPGPDPAPADSPLLKSVWDFEKIEKSGGPDPFSRKWSCGWCGMTLKGWNATKALNHVAKAAGNNDVKACPGSIPKATLALFQAFRYKKLGVASVKRQHQEAFTDSVAANQTSVAVMFENQRVRVSASAGITTIDMTGDGGGGVAASNSTLLTSAIAEFVFCKGLSFSAVEGEHFLQILKLARLVGNKYRPPHRRLLANELLEVSYNRRMEKYLMDLDVEADVYGLSIFGDGATVHGMPLMNVLASGVGEPCAVLAVVDCKFFVACFFFDFNLKLTDCCCCWLLLATLQVLIILLMVARRIALSLHPCSILGSRSWIRRVLVLIASSLMELAMSRRPVVCWKPSIPGFTSKLVLLIRFLCSFPIFVTSCGKSVSFL
jgi:hypothetical protein